jgi:hypothetical protein
MPAGMIAGYRFLNWTNFVGLLRKAMFNGKNCYPISDISYQLFSRGGTTQRWMFPD